MVTFENQNIEFKQEYVPDLRKEVMKYMERRGSGLRKIVSETEKLPGYTAAYKPEFSSTATDFRVILKNVNYNMCGASVHVAAHDTSVISKQNLLLEFCADPKSRDEMQAYIDVSRQTQKQKPEIHYRSFQIIFASFTHTSNPELHILNPVPYPTASGSPIGLIKNAINNKINPFCGEYVINTATPNKAKIMLISPRTRPDT